MGLVDIGNTKVIYCERCKGDAELENGCATCGGHRTVLGAVTCRICKREAWVRPGVHTSYEGKRWHTFDGVEWVDHKSSSNCADCEKP